MENRVGNAKEASRGLSRNDSVEKGIATISVAAIGVSPLASARGDNVPIGCVVCIFDLVGGTRPGRAIPETN